MSYRVANQVKQTSTAKHGARLVLLLLADYADDAGVCWPGHSTLCQDAGLSSRQIVRILQTLAEKGDISVLKRGDGRGNNTVYRLEKYAVAPFDPARYGISTSPEITAQADPETAPEKGDISGIKGDIIDIPAPIKGDIFGRAYKDEPSGEVITPLKPPQGGAVAVEVGSRQGDEQAQHGERDEASGASEANETSQDGQKQDGAEPTTSGANPEPRKRKRGAATATVLPAEQQRLFDLWYQHYPNKAGRQKAVEAWAKINPDADTVKAMAEGLKRWKESRDWKTLGAVKHPATWLNQRNWEDFPQRADEVPQFGAKGFGTAANLRPAGPSYREWTGDDD